MKLWKKNEGFTLVELVVVIAILGILAGVGTVGYSGYIKSANMAADEQMANGVKNALILAGIDGSLPAGSAVVMTTDENAKLMGKGDSGYVVLDDSTDPGFDALDGALRAAFGANYAETLKLKYNGWTGTAVGADMANVQESNFKTENLPTLLNNVNTLTTVLNGYLDGMTPEELSGLSDYAKSLGADPNALGTQGLANLAPMQVAADLVTNAAGNSAFEELYTNPTVLWTGCNDAVSVFHRNVGVEEFTGFAIAYAQTQGIINYIVANAEPEDKDAALEMSRKWDSDTASMHGRNDVSNVIDMVKGELYENYNDYVTEYFKSVDDNDQPIASQAQKDAKAFLSYMRGVDEVKETLAQDVEGMKSGTYYKSEAVANVVSNYVSSSEILSSAGVENGSVAVFYNGNGMGSSYPMDYRK